jgi:hypothetical protein
MTPSQWLISQLVPVIQSNNPGASSDEVTAYATSLAGLYFNYILPNLQVNLTTGAISFVVPSS